MRSARHKSEPQQSVVVLLTFWAAQEGKAGKKPLRFGDLACKFSLRTLYHGAATASRQPNVSASERRWPFIALFLDQQELEDPGQGTGSRKADPDPRPGFGTTWDLR